MPEKFSKENFLRLSAQVLNHQFERLYPIDTRSDPQRITLVFLNHDRNVSTYQTIRYLVEHGRVADIYTLSRSMYESVVYMALLVKQSIPDDLIRYQDYQFVEIDRTHQHLKRLGLERLDGLSDQDAILARDRMEQYTGRWGKRSPSWTGHTLEVDAKLVDTDYPPTCNENHFYEYLYCQVYRKGSASSHSSFSGLSKGVVREKLDLPGISGQRMGVNEPHLVFSSFNALLVFLSSIRFMGTAMGKDDWEKYFQEKARYIIAED